MRKAIFIFATVAVIAIVFSCGQVSGGVKVAAVDKDSLVRRGEYLVTVMGCNDCHTPLKMTDKGPRQDPDRLLSGYPSLKPLGMADATTAKNWVLFDVTATAMMGPWGVSFAGNLTSDPTGIGNWTEEQFKKAMTQGKYKGLDGGRILLPPMPWENYRHLKDEEVKAIFAYLKSTKPVRNIVPAAVPPAGLGQYMLK